MDDDRFSDEVADMDRWPWEPTPLEECREALRSELGCITASTPAEARVHGVMVRAVDDLLRYVERFPALRLLHSQMHPEHPAEPYVRAARAALDVEIARGVPGLARTACAHEIAHWRRIEDDIGKGGPLW